MKKVYLLRGLFCLFVCGFTWDNHCFVAERAAASLAARCCNYMFCRYNSAVSESGETHTKTKTGAQAPGFWFFRKDAKRFTVD
ncbi:MAG TPA: hypothetical protein P5116_07540 [Eubacteriales bacterium]|nr:hypothetical protein [Eubacteriales bacterium]